MKIIKKIFPFELSFKSIFARVLTGWFLTALMFLMLFPNAANKLETVADYNLPLFGLCFVSFTVLLTRIEYEPIVSAMLAGVSTLYFVIAAAFGNDAWFSVGLCLAAAAVFVFADLKIPNLVRSKRSLLVAATVCFVLFTAIVGTVCSLYYRNDQTSCFDFGLFSQMFYYMKETGKQLVTCERDGLLSHFAVHFSPVYYLILPFYMLIPRPETLLFLQAAIVASGVFPLVLLCEKLKLPPKLSAVLLLCFSLYPAFWGGCFYYLHENCFLVSFLLWLFYFYEKESTAGIIVFTVLTLSVKEDAPVYAAVAALFFLVSKKKPLLSLSMIGISVAWFIGVTTYLSKYGDGVMTGRFGNLIYGDGGFVEILKNVFQDPIIVIREAFEKDKILYFVQATVTLFFLPLMIKKPERLILLLPLVLFNLIPDYGYQHQMGYQYGFGSGTFLIYLSALNLSEIEDGKKRDKQALIALACAAIVFFGLFSGKLSYYKTYKATVGERETIDNAMSCVKEDSPVAASAFFVPALSSRKTIYELETTKHLDECEYIVIDMRRKYDEELFKMAGYKTLAYTENVIAVLEKENIS